MARRKIRLISKRPVPGTVLLVCALASGAASLLYGISLAEARVADWGVTSSSVREGLTFAGPVAGAITLLFMARVFSRRSMILPVTSSRSFVSVAMNAVTRLSASAVLGYLVGLVPALWSTADRSLAGEPDLLVIVSALPVMGAFVSVAVFGASVLRGAWTLILGLVMLVVFAGGGAPASARWLSLAPTWGGVTASAGAIENPLLTSFRLLFFLGLTSSLVLATANRLATRSGWWVNRMAVTAAPLLLLAPLLFWGATRPVDVLVPEPNPPTKCAPAADIRACVHAIRGGLLPTVVETLDAVARPLEGLSQFGIDSVEDRALIPYPASDPLVIPIELFASLPAEVWQQQGRLEVASAILGGLECPVDSSATSRERREVQAGLAGWLYTAAGFGAPSQIIGLDRQEVTTQVPSAAVYWALTQHDNGAVAEWLMKSRADLRDCKLSLADVPWL